MCQPIECQWVISECRLIGCIHREKVSLHRAPRLFLKGVLKLSLFSLSFFSLLAGIHLGAKQPRRFMKRAFVWMRHQTKKSLGTLCNLKWSQKMLETTSNLIVLLLRLHASRFGAVYSKSVQTTWRICNTHTRAIHIHWQNFLQTLFHTTLARRSRIRSQVDTTYLLRVRVLSVTIPTNGIASVYKLPSTLKNDIGL